MHNPTIKSKQMHLFPPLVFNQQWWKTLKNQFLRSIFFNYFHNEMAIWMGGGKNPLAGWQPALGQKNTDLGGSGAMNRNVQICLVVLKELSNTGHNNFAKMWPGWVPAPWWQEHQHATQSSQCRMLRALPASSTSALQPSQDLHSQTTGTLWRQPWQMFVKTSCSWQSPAKATRHRAGPMLGPRGASAPPVALAQESVSAQNNCSAQDCRPWAAFVFPLCTTTQIQCFQGVSSCGTLGGRSWKMVQLWDHPWVAPWGATTQTEKEVQFFKIIPLL